MSNTVDAVIEKLEQKLPSQFTIKCSKTGKEVKMSRKTFLNHVRKVEGDHNMVLQNYVCRDARKDQDIDFLGRPKTKKSGGKLITDISI